MDLYNLFNLYSLHTLFHAVTMLITPPFCIEEQIRSFTPRKSIRMSFAGALLVNLLRELIAVCSKHLRLEEALQERLISFFGLGKVTLL